MTLSTAWLDTPHPERAMAFTRWTQFCLYALHEGAQPDEGLVFVEPIAFKGARAGGWGLFALKPKDYRTKLDIYLNISISTTRGDLLLFYPPETKRLPFSLSQSRPELKEEPCLRETSSCEHAIPNNEPGGVGGLGPWRP